MYCDGHDNAQTHCHRHISGVIIATAMLERMKVGKGDVLHAVEAADAACRLTPYDPVFADKMALAGNIIGRYRSTLNLLGPQRVVTPYGSAIRPLIHVAGSSFWGRSKNMKPQINRIHTDRRDRIKLPGCEILVSQPPGHWVFVLIQFICGSTSLLLQLAHPSYG
jgi:hypothetical protein